MGNEGRKIGRPSSISTLIWANGILGLVGILIFLLYFFPFRPTHLEVSGFPIPEPLDLELAIAFLIGGGIHFIVLHGLLRAKRWGRLAQKIVATPYFLSFPFGTIYALLIFLSLNREEAGWYFSQNSHR